MNYRKFMTFALAFASLNAFASTERKLFTMEKNYNSENVMIIHTQTDEDCRFVTSKKNNENNYLEFYWLMNGTHKKEVHSMIRSEIKGRVKFEGMNARRDSFRVRLNDMKELKHDLPDTSMEVISEVSQGKCTVKSVLGLGASSKYRKINLSRVYCEVTKNLIGVPNGCQYIQLDGSDIDTGEKVSVRFKKK